MKPWKLIAILLCLPIVAFAQTAVVEGYVFETGNRGYLEDVKITILNQTSGAIVGEAITDKAGFFTVELTRGEIYQLRAEKKIYNTVEQVLSTRVIAGEKVYVKVEMMAQGGYLFELTLAEKRDEMEPVDAINESRIEVYNNTTQKQELDLNPHAYPTFRYTLEQGNHYTILVRKDGYLNKRIEAYVNVKGCIVCIDGVSDLTPGVLDNMSSGFETGTLLANLEMEQASVDKKMKIDNIYYDLNKYEIRSDAKVELNKLVGFLKDNPSLLVELGSHTDSRGDDKYNTRLSRKRAEAAVAYIVKTGGISKSRISAKGYGASQLVNDCKPGVDCSEEEHQENRRTELKITGFTEFDPFELMTLEQIIRSENTDELLKDIQSDGTYQFDQLPPEVQEQIRQQEKARQEKAKAKKAAKEEGALWQPKASPLGLFGSFLLQSNTLGLQRFLRQQQDSLRQAREAEEVDPMSIQEVENFEEPFQEDLFDKPVKTNKKKIRNNRSNSPFSRTNNDNLPASYEGPRGLPGNRKKKRQIQTEEEVTGKEFFNEVQILSNDFSGYMIEIYYAQKELSKDHEIFYRHGNIVQEDVPDGGYAYLVGKFKEEEEAEKFRKEVMVHQYKECRVVEFKFGIRQY